MVQIPYPLAQLLRLLLVLPLLTIAILPAVLWQLVGILLTGTGTGILFIYISSFVIVAQGIWTPSTRQAVCTRYTDYFRADTDAVQCT